MPKVFDILAFLMGKAAGGGGGDIIVESKSISSNGTYTAPAGKAYSPVTVNVPNSYAAGDEGKVVSNGALVSQSSDSVTQNGTVDTTLINSLTVNVPGGSSWTLLASKEFTVSTSSTTETEVGKVELPNSNYGPEDIIWVHIRDKAGKRSGYWFGSDSILINYPRGSINPASTDAIVTVAIFELGQCNGVSQSTSKFGIYPIKMTQEANDHEITIAAKYRASDGTIDGTYKVDVYKLAPASGMTIFDT